MKQIPHFLSLIDETKLKREERIIFGSQKTLFFNLIKFCLGIHEKFNEEPDISKLVLAGITRAEYLKNSNEYEVLSKNYKDFFIITQFFQSSYRVSQGPFLERMFAALDPHSSITLGLNPQYLLSYILYPELCRKNSLFEINREDKKELKGHKNDVKIKFKSKKFSRGKIDITKRLNSKLIIAEQRSRANTGGTTAAASNFEKGFLFLKEISVLLKDGHEELEKLLHKLIDEGITHILFLSAGIFAEDETWATDSKDPQIKAKKNEFKKLRDYAKDLALNYPEMIAYNESSDKKTFELKLFEKFQIKIEYHYCYGMEYLNILYNQEFDEEKIKEFDDKCITDDLWISLRIAIFEREIYALYQKNHILAFQEFINSNTDIQKKWLALKKKFREENNNFSELFQKLNNFVKKIVFKFFDLNDWERTDPISSKIKEKHNYLEKIVYILLIAEKEDLWKFNNSLDPFL